jgi:hypothetical protein
MERSLLAILHFAQPGLLLGLAVAALPLLIHWWLRHRPQRVRFPAVAFLQTAMVSGDRARRLRNLWLLLTRTLVIACSALLLAGPTCAPAGGTAPESRPAACAVVLDDSWSMHYQLTPVITQFDRTRQEALTLLRSTEAWPAGSAFALVLADPRVAAEGMTTERGAIIHQLRTAAATKPHAAPLGHAVDEAGRLLRGAQQPVRRLLVFTDAAAHAWRDVQPGALTGIEGLSVRVIAPAAGQRTNIAITAAAGPARLHPTGTPVPIETTLASAGLDAECWLVAEGERGMLARVGPLQVPADGTRDVSLLLPALSPGASGVTLRVEPSDRLDSDQRRYVVFEAGERPIAWLVTAPDAGPDDNVTALILRNLLAPESLEPDGQVLTLRHVPGEQIGQADEGDSPQTGEAGAPGQPAFLVVLSGAETSETGLRFLLDRIRHGATMLLAPAGRDGDGDWPGLRPLVSASPPKPEAAAAVTSIAWEDGSPYSAAEEGLDELARCTIRRRLVLGRLAEGVSVQARYADGVPAIVSKQLGKGRLIMLTTSPDPAWSELGIRAAGLLTWVHRLIEEAAGPPSNVASFRVGERTRHRFGGLPTQGLVRVSSISDPQDKPAWVRVADGAPEQDWPTDQPGLYAVRAAGKHGRPSLYAVNWPAAEADLTPISLPRLKARLGLERVTLELADGRAAEAQPGVLARLLADKDPMLVLPLLLMVLFVTEVMLANRPGRAQASKLPP